MIEAEVVHAAKAGLGEGCVWSPLENLLIWVDVIGQTVHRFDHASARPHSSMRYDDTVSIAIPRATGGLALGMGTSVALCDPSGTIESTIALDEPDSNRTNDGAVDPAGRLFVGTMSHIELGAPVAALHRVDPDGSTQRLFGGVTISNGIDWSLDGSIMYYIDTLTLKVDCFDYDYDTGAIDNRRTFISFDGSTGVPDGMTVDAEGCLWVAMFGGGHVQRFSPEGEKLESVPTPAAPQTTCCCFGGPDLDILYITTGFEPIGGFIDTSDAPNSGALFAADVDAVGRHCNLFAG